MSKVLVQTIRNIKKREKLLVTPGIEDWLASPAGALLGLETEEDFALLRRLALASKDNSKRSGRFGASARGTCQRRQIFAFLGMPVSSMMDSRLQNIFNDGTFRHIRWQLMGMKAGVFTDVEVRLGLPDWRLGISMDAIDDRVPYVFELKGTSMNISSMRHTENIPYPHVLQTHTYMFATGWDLAIYLPESKSSQDWQEVHVRRDEKVIREVKRELNQLNGAVDDEILPTIQPECSKKKGDYKQCPYARQCLAQEAKGDPWPDDGQWAGH